MKRCVYVKADDPFNQNWSIIEHLIFPVFDNDYEIGRKSWCSARRGSRIYLKKKTCKKTKKVCVLSTFTLLLCLLFVYKFALKDTYIIPVNLYNPGALQIAQMYIAVTASCFRLVLSKLWIGQEIFCWNTLDKSLQFTAGLLLLLKGNLKWRVKEKWSALKRSVRS